MRAQASKHITYGCHIALTLLSAAVLAFTLRTGESFTYAMGHFPAPFGNEIRAGALEAFMALLFCLVSLLSIAGGQRDIFRELEENRINVFLLMMNMLTSALLVMVYTNDLFTAYIFIEIITISACYIVAARPGGRPAAASIVYLIMSLVGSCLILISIALLYGVTGHLLMPGLRQSVRALAASGDYRVPLFVLTGLMTAGLAIKTALFPFHSWLPNAHASATTAASAVLSGLIIKCYLFLLIKLAFRTYGLDVIGELQIANLMLVFGALGIIYGSLMARRQRDIKQMLSYSSVAQIGFISVAIGLNTEAGMAAACFHIAAHAVGKAMLFVAASGLSAASGNAKDFDALRGAARRDPLSGAAFIIGGLAISGIPPFFGFFSKMYLTFAAVDTPIAGIVIFLAVVVSTVLSAMYYFPAILCILEKSDKVPEDHIEKGASSLAYRAAVGAFIAASLFLGFFSRLVISVIEKGLAVFG
ncbi:MAG: sodium:proton antiporter [Clostridiales bacterium]|nr:sodium:proton antiporter [Clostridiales bacterium]